MSVDSADCNADEKQIDIELDDIGHKCEWQSGADFRIANDLPVNAWIDFDVQLLEDGHHFGVADKTTAYFPVNFRIQWWRQFDVADEEEEHAEEEGQGREDDRGDASHRETDTGNLG